MAVSKVKKFANIVDGTMTVPKWSESISKEDIAIRDLNQAVYCCLLYCMNDDISFSLVDTAKTENLPYGGKSFTVVQILK